MFLATALYLSLNGVNTNRKKEVCYERSIKRYGILDNKSLAVNGRRKETLDVPGRCFVRSAAGTFGFRSSGYETMGALRSVLSDVRCGGILQ